MKLLNILLPALFFSSATATVPTDTATMGLSLGEVVVTGTNQATSRNLLPYTVSVVNHRQIEATGQTQLLAALSGEVPSLFVTQRGIFGFGVSNGGSGGIKIRGVGGSPTNAVLMMVDGQPQFAGLYSHPVADIYESEYVDHVEIMRGPGSVLYGSNAMGGVINVITRNPHTEGVATTISTQFGSYNTWQSSLTNTVRYGRFSSMISLGYDRTDGTTDHFDFKQYSLYAKAGYDFSPHWTLTADYTLMNFIGNDPVYAKLSNPGSTDIYHQNVVRGEGSLALTDSYGGINGVLRVYYSYGNHFIDDPNHFHSLDDRLGVLGYQNFPLWHSAQATAGFDFATYSGKIPESGGHTYGDGSMPARMQTMARRRITEYSPYVTLQQSLFANLLTLNAGIRMANSDMFGTRWLPQVGASVRPGAGWLVKVSLAKGYRNPSFRELYLYGTANDRLRPESMMNYELTVGRRFSRYLNVDVTAYYAKGDDMIQIASVATAEGGSTQRNVNTGGFENSGIELSAQSTPVEALSLRTSYSYLHTSLASLTGAPTHQYFLGFTWRALRRLTIDASLRVIGCLYVAEDVARQDYALLDVRVSYTPLRWLEAFVAGNNITNSKYQINKGYEMPGFTASGGVKFKF